MVLKACFMYPLIVVFLGVGMFSPALAQGTTTVTTQSSQVSTAVPAGTDLLQLGLPVIFMLAIYLLVIRPNNKRLDEQKKMVETLKVGDEVVTTGGLMGIIGELHENHLMMKVADGVIFMMQRSSIQHILPKGTIKFSSGTKHLK